MVAMDQPGNAKDSLNEVSKGWDAFGPAVDIFAQKTPAKDLLADAKAAPHLPSANIDAQGFNFGGPALTMAAMGKQGGLNEAQRAGVDAKVFQRT